MTCEMTELLVLSDRDLALHAGAATHQHYKGGLYRLLGVPRDADTGDALLNGQRLDQRVAYEHLWPNDKGLWVRDLTEFEGYVVCPAWHPAWKAGRVIKRFRPLGSAWTEEN